MFNINDVLINVSLAHLASRVVRNVIDLQLQLLHLLELALRPSRDKQVCGFGFLFLVVALLEVGSQRSNTKQVVVAFLILVLGVKFPKPG